MAIAPQFTFSYQFTVQQAESRQRAGPVDTVGRTLDVSGEVSFWTGQGSGGEDAEALVGANPTFELSAGWLTLLPAAGWDPEKAAAVAWHAKWPEVPFLDIAPAEIDASRARLGLGPVRKGTMKSWSVYVGEGLQDVMRVGDTLRCSLNLSGELHYNLIRADETILSAGTIGGLDLGGPVAIWQSRDAYRNSKLEEIMKAQPPAPAKVIKDIREMQAVFDWNRRLQEIAYAHKVYANVRVNDQVFHLVDRQKVHVDPYYVFLARTNALIVNIDVTPGALHSFGRIDIIAEELTTQKSRTRRWWNRRCLVDAEELIMDAAEQLAAPKVRIL